MVHVALLVKLQAKPGKEAEVESFLRGGQAIVEDEPATRTWFALRLGPSTFGIFDTFADEKGRQAHLSGKVAAALMAKAPQLLREPPSIQRVDVLASKMLPTAVGPGLLVTLPAKSGREADVEKFLTSGRPIVEDEPATTSWYGIRIDAKTYGIFDAFPNEAGRGAHLNGRVAAALMAKASELLSSAPDIQRVDVLAAKL